MYCKQKTILQFEIFRKGQSVQVRIKGVIRDFEASRLRPIALEVHEELVNGIVKGALLRGQKIIELELAKALEVSRPKVR